ncbi:centromere protein R-like isoform X2 [Neophocaena asiaeorientalis asiaeorientalis]|uniref:Centromere protein R-like isoform X2 n=1 Tax=Neophocaena asiaeorientalis asiaeorientalis TaxID=1706337 RepID=A0A341B1Y7_NEOAA|nr:centromere protein R-like isoform X2 [Neophocaena asiaeorientalis asiaeorientalis]
MVLLSKVEKSSDEFMEIMQNALEDSRELENLIGISHTSGVLKREMQKTKDLLTKVTKQKLFEKKNSGLPNKATNTLMRNHQKAKVSTKLSKTTRVSVRKTPEPP